MTVSEYILHTLVQLILSILTIDELVSLASSFITLQLVKCVSLCCFDVHTVDQP